MEERGEREEREERVAAEPQQAPTAAEVATGERVRQKFPKPCRLRLKTLVDPLFADGRSEYAYPLRMVWRNVDAAHTEGILPRGSNVRVGRVQMLVSIPKRRQRRAVDRVLLRRRVREAYRRLLPAFEERVSRRSDIATLSLAVVYISDKIESQARISARLEKLLDAVAEKLEIPA